MVCNPTDGHKKGVNAAKSLPIIEFFQICYPRIVWQRFTPIYLYILARKQFLLLINLFVVLRWLNRPAVFLQILLKSVFYDVVPLVLFGSLLELRLFLFFPKIRR